MIYFLSLFTSLFIQLGAFDIPYEMHYDDTTLQLMLTFSEQAESSEDERILYFADVWRNGNIQYFLFSGQNGNYEIWFDASQYNSSYNSSVVGRVEENTNDILQLEIQFNRYYRIIFNPNYTSSLSCDFPNDYGWTDYVYCRVYPYRQDSYKYLYYFNGVLHNSNNSPIIYGDYVFTEPVDPETSAFGSLGVLNITGHSSGGIPLEELDSFSWSNSSHSFALTGHSVGVSQNQSTPDFTNPVQNLLGQIIDNSNKIIQNIKGVGDYFEELVGNIREGFSAVFNAISQFNNNAISFFDYIKEPLDQDLIMDHVEDMSFMQLADSISAAGSHVSSSFNNVSNNQTLVFPIDLRNTIFSNAGIMYLDLSFLDDTKSTWQPLLIAFLYITLTFNIIMSLPSIIQGQSREGGKSD